MKTSRYFAGLSAAVVAIAVACPASADVIENTESGFVVRTSVEVPADEWATWSALTSPAKWWSPGHTWSGKAENLYIDSQATGCFCELLPVPEGAPEGTRRGSVEHMHIVYSSPGKMLRMKGALGPMQGEALSGTMTMTVKALPKGTRISWEYVVGGYMRMKVDDLAPMVDQVLGEQIARLGKLLGAEPAEKATVRDEPPGGSGPAKKASGS